MTASKSLARRFAVVGALFALTVFAPMVLAQSDQDPVYSSNATIAVGASFTPSYSGGDGSGGWQFCVASYTTWQGGNTSDTGTMIGSSWYSSWTPPSPGTYTFYVVRDGDWEYNPSSYSSAYTLTVTKDNQASISSSNSTITFNGTTQSYPSFTPTYSGGSGTGSWQFCIAGYTNWDVGGSSYAGTNTGTTPGSSSGAVWVSSWTPSAPGTYYFWVARDGNSTYNSSGASAEYTLTVNGPVDAIQWNSVSLPGTGGGGQNISFTANVTNTGTSYWNTNYYLGVKNSSGTLLYSPSISGISPAGSISPTFLLTLPTPSTPTSYTYTFTAYQSVGDFGTDQTASITVYPLPAITSSTSASGTYGTAFSYSITASNSPTSYSASGLPPGLSLNSSTGVISGTPTAGGTWSVTVGAANTGGSGSTTVTFTITGQNKYQMLSIYPTYTSVSSGTLSFVILRPAL